MKNTILLIVIMIFFSCKEEKKETVIIEKQEINIVSKVVKDIVLSSGTIQRVESFPSKYVQPRNVDVWLPNNYSNDKKYSVLYMHDGQMLFDARTTWNEQEWKVDEFASSLMNEGKVRDFIVVAIWNISDIRHSEYFPNKPFQNLTKKDSILENAKSFNQGKLFKTNIQSDNYLRFIVKEVKPYVDSQFSTLTDRDNTFIMGSSMGGLISMYAICEYPNVFGGAACISTHWPGVLNNPIPHVFFEYMKEMVPSPKAHKFYFDYGTETLDKYYPQYASRVDTIFLDKGYNDSNFKNIKFEGADHSENSWNQRLDIPLTFLLGKSDE